MAVKGEPPPRTNNSGVNAKWTEWMDGDWWKIELGVDIGSTTISNARSAAHTMAVRQMLRVETRKDPDPRYLWLRFRPK